MLKQKNMYFKLFLVFISICMLISAVLFQYYNKLQDTIREESNDYLQEVSRQISSNIYRTINDNYAVLNTMVSILDTVDAQSFSDVAPVVNTQKKYWKYQSIMLIDQNGTAYNANGKEVRLNVNSSLTDAIINKKPILSTAQMVDNQEQIVFTIPLNHLKIGDKYMSAIAACYDPSTFDQSLSMTAFEGQAFSQIVSKSGTVVVRSSAPSSIKTGYNVISTIANAEMDRGSSLECLKYDFEHGKTGQVGFTLDGTKVYMVYTPVQTEDWILLTFIPVSVVNARSDMMLRITLMVCGLIVLIFAGLLTFILFSFKRHRKKLEQIAYVDNITGGNTIEHFYELGTYALSQANKPPYALIYTNIAKFKVLNDQFGRSTCDEILKAFNDSVSAVLTGNECIGRISGDNFCILIEYQNDAELLTWFNMWFTSAEKMIQSQGALWALPLTELGVYIINDDLLSFPQMIDRAKLALRELPRSINHRLRYSVYDDVARRHLFREKQLEDMMEQSLEEGEFQVFLQPKYWVSDETIGGAEALSRWVSKSEGMIFPDEFIPIFEKNGFIIILDLWVFEQVCKQLRGWLDAGLKPVCISVNCSRVHLQDPDFLRPYRKIAIQYDIPDGLIEIELTESVVMEDIQALTQIIHDIHEAGFNCSMDDFGSGYSSLNMIQSIPVDTLKLDKIFFHGNADDGSRIEAVVSSILSMAKALSLKTVAEGIEYRSQVDMLKRMNCDMIQGYVFAKPMPISAFEKLAFGDVKPKEQ